MISRMVRGLRREGGRSSAPGVFSVSGTLAGISGPGRRAVTTLQLRGLGPGEDLSVLANFRDLKELELDQVRGLDLSPLTSLAALRSLIIKNATGLDLGHVTGLVSLESLGISDIDGCRIPSLALPPTLRILSIVNDSPSLTGQQVQQACGAIEWVHQSDLRALDIRVGGLHEMRPIEVNLGFLRLLPMLDHLDLHAGVRHAGPLPSPIEPPFEGLSKRLTFCRIDAWHPDLVRAALCAHLGVDSGAAESGLAVYQRPGVQPPAPQPATGGPDGSTIGSPPLAEDTEQQPAELKASRGGRHRR